MKVGVVGHVEWVEFAVVDHVPAPGEILLSQRKQDALDDQFATERVADLELKGFSRPVNAVRLDQRELAVRLEAGEADADQP